MVNIYVDDNEMTAIWAFPTHHEASGNHEGERMRAFESQGAAKDEVLIQMHRAMLRTGVWSLIYQIDDRDWSIVPVFVIKLVLGDATSSYRIDANVEVSKGPDLGLT